MLLEIEMSGDRYAPYARETAMCVDFAYSSFEEDIRRELASASGTTRTTLLRLLSRVTERRSALDQFVKVTAPKTA